MKKALATMVLCGSALGAANALGEEPPSQLTEPWAVRWQVTNVTQWHPPFHSPYEGDNSLLSHGRTEETTDLTLYAGARLWRGGELWVNPEIDQGFGLSSTLGLAGFSSGEAYKIGANKPYFRLPRVFVRHTIDLGGDAEGIESGLNQLAGSRTANNVTLTLGKFSAGDIFDANAYAHDPRTDFLNWSIIDSGAFDYAADSWGFTYGAAAEWTQDWWTLRGGIFQLSPVPNAKVIAVDFSKFMFVAEAEERHRLGERPGKLKLLAFVNHAPMARYRDAVDLARLTGGVPDVSLVRRVANRPGLALIFEQELADDLGVFARASVNDGSKEAYEFTEINKSIALGASLKGKRWGRAEDTVGIAAVANGLSGDAREYFAAGGLGILIGDGALNYKPERIVEAYYAARLGKHLAVSFDYQHIDNPAHNADRGPANIFAIRVHAEF